KTYLLIGFQLSGQRLHDPVTEPRFVKPASEPDASGVCVAIVRWFELDESSRDSSRKLSSGQVVREIGRVEVLQTAQADENKPAAAAQIAGDHRLWHQRRRLRHADGGRQQPVVVEPSPVAELGGAPAQPVQGLGDAVRGDVRVWMSWMRRDESRQRLLGTLH